MTAPARAVLGTAWWEERPRGMVAGGIAKAAEQISTVGDAPPGMEQYQDDPVGFMVDQLGIGRHTLVWSELPEYENHTWDGTPDPMARWFQALVDWEDVGVESATGTGKSFGLALTKLWFNAVWQGSRCFDYAAVKEQLTEYSYMEVGKLWPKFKVLFPSAHFSPTAPRIRMDGRIQEGDTVGWGALGRGVKVGAGEEIAAGAAGMHAAHMLISVEEAQGFHHAASRALENTATAPHNLRQYVGNPDSNDDPLHQFCLAPSTVHIRMSALDHPNVVVNNARDPDWKDLKGDVMVVPGAVSRTSIHRRRLKYGIEHRFYLSRVRGISPAEHQDALIKQAHIDRAVERWRTKELRRGFWAMGIDVARSEDGDKGAIAEGPGPHCDSVEAFPCPDPVALGVRVGVRIATREIFERNVGVDVGGGYGGGTADKLKELGFYIFEFNGGAKAVQKIDETLLDESDEAIREATMFRNLRAQAHWRLAMDFQLDRIAIPDDAELHEELRSLRWEPKLGKVVVEEKKMIAARLGRSPDKADALVIWNWVRERVFADEEEDLAAWSQEALEAELELRKVKHVEADTRPKNLNPIVVETIK